MATTEGGIHFVVHDLSPVWAQGRAPVLFHHGIGTNLHIWDEWAPIVGADRPVIRFDMRGWGQSVVPPEGHDWSIEEMIDDVWSVADAFGARKLHLVGESFGGSVVLAAALAKPSRASSIFMTNATFKGQGLGELANWPAQFASGVETWSDAMMRNRFLPDVLDRAKESWFRSTQELTKPYVAIGLGAVLDRLDLSGALAELTTPLSYALPDSSPFVPIAHAAALKQIAPAVRIRIVPNVKHGLPFSHARTEAADLRDFLRSLD